MTTSPTSKQGRAPHDLRLREEDLQPGRPFVHPETRLEYADFHAYLCGKDPLPHWRNARIKEVLVQCHGDLSKACIATDYGRGPCVAGSEVVDDFFRFYNRSGERFVHAYGRSTPAESATT